MKFWLLLLLTVLAAATTNTRDCHYELVNATNATQICKGVAKTQICPIVCTSSGSSCADDVKCKGNCTGAVLDFSSCPVCEDDCPTLGCPEDCVPDCDVWVTKWKCEEDRHSAAARFEIAYICEDTGCDEFPEV